MKTPSNDLFRLIKTLSPAERRQWQQQQGSSQLRQLFDHIQAQETYNEALIKEALGGQGKSFAANLKVHKVRLYQELLQFLRDAKAELSPAERIRRQIDGIEILLQRQLFDLAYKAIQQAKSACLEWEEYELLLVILGIQARQEAYFKELQPEALTSTQQLAELLRIIENYTEWARLNTRLKDLLLQRSTFDESGFQKVLEAIDKEILQPYESIRPLSAIAARMHNHCLFIWRDILGDLQNAHRCTRANVEIMLQRQALINEKPMQYFNILVNHIVACSHAMRFEELQECLQIQEGIAERQPFFKPYLLYAYFEVLQMLKALNRWEEALVFYETKALPIIEQYNLSEKYAARVLLLKIAEIYLVLQRRQEAGRLLLSLSAVGQSLDYELSTPFLVLEIVYHIECNNLLALQSWVEALRKRMQRQKAGQKLLPLIVNFAQRYSSTSTEGQAKALARHADQFEDLEPQAKNELCRIENFFAYSVWIQARKEGINWAEALRVHCQNTAATQQVLPTKEFYPSPITAYPNLFAL